MSFRQLTKPSDTHFLARYRCDNKLQVRTAGFIRSEEIALDETYDVQWGNKGQVDVAVIIASGSEKEMRTRMSKEQVPTQTSKPQTSKPQKSKPQKRKATESIKTPSGKPAAKVLVATSPPGFYPVTTVQVTDNCVSVTTTTSVSSSPVTRVTATTGSVCTTTVSPPTPVIPLPSVPDTSTTTSPVSTTVCTPSVTPSTPSRPEFAFRAVRPTSGNQLLTYLQSIDAAQGSILREVEKLKKQGEATARKYNEIIDNQRTLRELMEKMVSQGSVPPERRRNDDAAQDQQCDRIPEQYSIDET